MLGDTLRKLRKERKWSQKVLSEKSGVNQGFISEIESGKKTPGLDTLRALSHALGTSISFLTDDVETPPSGAPPPTAIAEEQSEYSLQPLSKEELYLVRTFRKLHDAEKQKVIEIAELYCGVKEPWRNAGGGSDSKESNSK